MELEEIKKLLLDGKFLEANKWVMSLSDEEKRSLVEWNRNMLLGNDKGNKFFLADATKGDGVTIAKYFIINNFPGVEGSVLTKRFVDGEEIFEKNSSCVADVFKALLGSLEKYRASYEDSKYISAISVYAALFCENLLDEEAVRRNRSPDFKAISDGYAEKTVLGAYSTHDSDQIKAAEAKEEEIRGNYDNEVTKCVKSLACCYDGFQQKLINTF